MSTAAPAPDLETLFTFEPTIEPACRNQLVALGVEQVQVQQDAGDQVSGRVDVQLVMGAARPNASYIPKNLPDGVIDSRACFECAWDATLIFSVVTERTENPQLHRAYVAKVRALMVRFFSQFPPELLPFHDIFYARSAGTVVGLETNKQEDVTQLRYACGIAIRDSAWPAPY